MVGVSLLNAVKPESTPALRSFSPEGQSVSKCL